MQYDIQILLLQTAYCAHTGLAVSTVSRKCAGSGAALNRISAGKPTTLQRLERIIQWFSDHWPTDLPWPPDVPRPVSLPPSSGSEDGAPGEEAAPQYGDQPRSLAAWCRAHGFEERQAREVISLYGDEGKHPGRKPRRQTKRVVRGQTYVFKNERLMIWEQFIKDRDPRFKQAIAFTDLAGLINPGGAAA